MGGVPKGESRQTAETELGVATRDDAAVVRTFCVKTPIIVVKYDIKMVGMISDTKTVGSHLTQKLWEGH